MRSTPSRKEVSRHDLDHDRGCQAESPPLFVAAALGPAAPAHDRRPQGRAHGAGVLGLGRRGGVLAVERDDRPQRPEAPRPGPGAARRGRGQGVHCAGHPGPPAAPGPALETQGGRHVSAYQSSWKGERKKNARRRPGDPRAAAAGRTEDPDRDPRPGRAAADARRAGRPGPGGRRRRLAQSGRPAETQPGHPGARRGRQGRGDPRPGRRGPTARTRRRRSWTPPCSSRN